LKTIYSSRFVNRSGNVFYAFLAITGSLSLLIYTGIYSYNYFEIRLMPDVTARLTILEGEDSPAILRYRTGVNSYIKEVPKKVFTGHSDGDTIELYHSPENPEELFFPPTFSFSIIILFVLGIVLFISGIKNLAYNRE